MKIQQILAGAAVLFAIGVAGPSVSAQSMRATIEVHNDAGVPIDCTVFWGNNRITFPATGASATSVAKEIPVSTGSRNFVCKKTGLPATTGNITPIKSFQTDLPGSYSIDCTARSTGADFACTLTSPAAG